MPDIEPFLAPIPGENPAGQNLYYAPIYDQIKEARRMEDTGPMGAWVREAKTADFKLVIKLAEGALLKNTKDLQIAAWLLEAWTEPGSPARPRFGTAASQAAARNVLGPHLSRE